MVRALGPDVGWLFFDFQAETLNLKLAGAEVFVALQKRVWLGGLIALSLAGSALAQSWGLGASVGLTNDVEKRFRIDEFKPRDINLWVDFRLEEKVLLRGTFGSLKVKGDNAGQTVSVTPGGPPTTLPDLTTRMDYGTVGVCYEFWEGEYSSGLFAGLGGYKIRPEAVATPFEPFRDPAETAFGWHVGAEGSYRIVSRLSLLGRLTVHQVRSESRRTLLTAGAGLLWHF